MMKDNYPLYDYYPGLKDRLPRIPFCRLPTPVKESGELAERWGIKNFFIKNDGVLNSRYGGNKVRKLEFILGEAKEKKFSRIVTIGAAGSNHALSTAIHGRRLGFRVGLVLITQKPSSFLRQNLLMDLKSGADLHFVDDNKDDVRQGIQDVLHHYSRTEGEEPFFIPAGGSSPEGTIGYINAAFELKRQIEQGLLPEPDRIYLPLGTAGTAGGLILGLKAAGLKTEVRPVLVVSPDFTDRSKVIKLIKKSNTLLHNITPAFPLFDPGEFNFKINKEMLGGGYGIPTPLGLEGVDVIKKTEEIKLEFTYSGKALAGVIDDGSTGKLKKKTVLFWNTYNNVEFSGEIKDMDYRNLPEPFHIYFED